MKEGGAIEREKERRPQSLPSMVLAEFWTNFTMCEMWIDLIMTCICTYARMS